MSQVEVWDDNDLLTSAELLGSKGTDSRAQSQAELPVNIVNQSTYLSPLSKLANEFIHGTYKQCH